MTENKYVVPEERLKKSVDAVIDLWERKPSAWNPSLSKREIALVAVEAFVKGMSENPLIPTRGQLQSIAYKHGRGECYPESITLYVTGFQEVMFRAPEPEVPEAIKDLLDPLDLHPDHQGPLNRRVIEAYRRGKESR